MMFEVDWIGADVEVGDEEGVVEVATGVVVVVEAIEAEVGCCRFWNWIGKLGNIKGVCSDCCCCVVGTGDMYFCVKMSRWGGPY